MSRHKEKVSQLSKQIIKQGSRSAEGGFVEQCRVIKFDVIKLRDDLIRGYTMAKNAIDNKTIVSELVKLRSSF